MCRRPAVTPDLVASGERVAALQCSVKYHRGPYHTSTGKSPFTRAPTRRAHSACSEEARHVFCTSHLPPCHKLYLT